MIEELKELVILEDLLEALFALLHGTLFPAFGDEVAEETEEVAIGLGTSELEFALRQLEPFVELGIVLNFWGFAEDHHLFQMEELGEQEDGVAHLVEVDEATLVVDM